MKVSSQIFEKALNLWPYLGHSVKSNDVNCAFYWPFVRCNPKSDSELWLMLFAIIEMGQILNLQLKKKLINLMKRLKQIILKLSLVGRDESLLFYTRIKYKTKKIAMKSSHFYGYFLWPLPKKAMDNFIRRRSWSTQM